MLATGVPSAHSSDTVLIPSQLRFKIKPRTPVATAMAKVGTSTNVDVTLVLIAGFIVGGLAAKGTFLQHDVTRSHAGLSNIDTSSATVV
jgi:hypothetical protein